MEIDRELLEDLLVLAEGLYEDMEHERGACRSIKQMYEQGDMPNELVRVKKLFNA